MATQDDVIRLIFQTIGTEGIDNLRAKLEQLPAEFGELNAALVRGGISLEEYNAETKRLTETQKGLSNALKELDKAAESSKGKVTRSGQSLTQFGRIVRDFNRGAIGGATNNFDGMAAARQHDAELAKQARDMTGYQAQAEVMIARGLASRKIAMDSEGRLGGRDQQALQEAIYRAIRANNPRMDNRQKVDAITIAGQIVANAQQVVAERLASAQVQGLDAHQATPEIVLEPQQAVLQLAH